MDFVFLINGRVALTSADMLQQRRENRELLWYNNYMVMDEELKQGDISISLHSRHEFLDRHGPLEGFEVFKMSSHQRASPLIQTHSPSWSLLRPLHFFSYITILFHLYCVIFIVICLDQKMFQYEFTNEDNKPLSRAKQLRHRFSLAGILGICKYGGVGKGFVDNGREIEGIKSIEIYSKQRENQSHTVIEQQEIIPVDKHISSGTTADHLDKLERKSIDFSPQSWKQRSQICIEVNQSLKCLHTGPMIIHNDLKPANILLDDKFVVRLPDFSFTKTLSFSESQSLDSTKLIGTPGYIAPDLIINGGLTKQSDIYSFGALVLKVLRGRAAREPRSEEDKCTLTTLAERTKVEDVDYDKSQQENMNLIVTNEKISLSDVWLHSICSTDDFHLRAEHIRRVYKSLYNKKSSVELGMLMTGLPQGFRFYPTDVKKHVVCNFIGSFREQQEQLPWVLGEGGFGRVYKRFMNCESDQRFRWWQATPGVLMDSSTGSQKCQIPPGFQCPEVELLLMDIDLYNHDPWDPPKRSFFGENEWFFSSSWDRKSAWGATSRYQKATGMQKPAMPKGITKCYSLMREYIRGAARGMHTEEEPVIYREFKASTILLNELYKAELSALAKEFSKKLNRLKEWQIKLGDLMDTSTGSHQWQMLPEIQLHPTDEDYGRYFVGLFDYEPWDLPKSSLFGEQEWFFFSLRDRKRATSGHHKATGMHNPVVPKGITGWVMMFECMLEDDVLVYNTMLLKN